MIDLLPADYSRKKSFDNEKILTIAMVVLLVIVVLLYSLFYLNLLAKEGEISEKISIVEAKIAEVSDKTKDISKLEEKNQLLEETLIRRQEIAATRLDWPLIISELSRLRPEKSWFANFNFNQSDGLRLRAYTLQQEELNLVVTNLKASSYFDDIVVDVAQKDENMTRRAEERVIYYQISTDLVNTRGEADDYR